ncbi:hypothetical protein DPEC_G00244070 [Dallia pectoralis]|uniref:Uncharacterized protein n=1 Tax=Dallia pectoralis TaxID=75939 RepID=A0ACC2FVX2_DALPE|nr:hypothetical protein DPEC_G00244070 [Dallia pectoralis]
MQKVMPLLELALLVLLVGRGMGVPVCRLQGMAELPELVMDGDLIIGGIFSFRTDQDGVIDTFQTIPKIRRCIKTIPSDFYQSRALAKLVKHFGWTWVGAICSDNDYGNDGLATFMLAAQEEGVCIEYSAAFEQTGPRRQLLKIVEMIEWSNSKVIVAFMTHREIKVLVSELHVRNITGLQWVGSDAWITDPSLTASRGYSALVGSVGFTVSRADIPGLVEHLRDIHPSRFPDSMFLREFWEIVFDCSLDASAEFKESRATALKA